MVWSDDDNLLSVYAFNGTEPTKVTVHCPSHESFFSTTYVRNYHLTSSGSDLSIISKSKRDVEKPWINLITENTILLMNRGAHYVPAGTYVSQLTDTLETIEKKYHDLILKQKLLVIFKDTHNGVIDYKGLFNSTPSIPNLSNYTIGQLNWGWNKFEEENILTKKLIQTSFKWVTYMNISGSTSYRSDTRRDGLHFCIPGPIDHWIFKFLEIINIFG